MENRDVEHPWRFDLNRVPGYDNRFDLVRAEGKIKAQGTPYCVETTVPPALAQSLGLDPKTCDIATALEALRLLASAPSETMKVKNFEATGSYPARYNLGHTPPYAIVRGHASGGKTAMSVVFPGPASSGGTVTSVGTSGLVQNFKMSLEGDEVVITASPGGSIAGAHNQNGKFETIIFPAAASGSGSSGGGGTYILPMAGPNTLGGVMLPSRTSDQTEPAGIDPKTGRVYTRPITGSGGGGGMKEYTCSAPAADAQKRMTPVGSAGVPAEGELFAATFTNGNSTGTGSAELVFGGISLSVRGQIPALRGYECVFYRDGNSAQLLNPRGGFAPGGASSAADLPAVVPAGLPSETAANTQAILDVLVKLAGNRVTPQMFGAKGDGKTDDTSALVSAAEYAKTHNVELYVPSDSTIKITRNVDLWGIRFIDSRGVISPSSNGITLTIGYTSQKIDGCVQRINDYEGTIIVDGGASCKFDIQKCFKIVFKTTSEERSYIGYCMFFLNYCEYLDFPPSDFEGGWINENRFYGGRYRKVTSRRPIGHNVWDGSLVEGTNFDIQEGDSNVWYNLRMEANKLNPDFKIHFGPKAINNRVYRDYFYAFPQFNDFAPLYLNIDFEDLNGSNQLIYDTGSTVCETYLITPTSNNFNTAAIIPSENSIKLKSVPSRIFKTGKIDITNGLGVRITSGQHIVDPPGGYKFITVMNLYDENGRLITELNMKKPVICDMPLSYEGDQAVRYGANDSAFNLQRYCRKSDESSKDSGVKYVELEFTATAESVPYLRVDFYQLSKYPQPILSTIDQRLRGDVPPAEGVYKYGDIVHNTGAKDTSCWGWMYKPSSGPDAPAEWLKLS